MSDFNPVEAHALDTYDTEVERHAIEHTLSKLLGARSPHQLLLVPQPDWLIPGLVQKKSIHIISSESGTGKTWLALQMALAGASESQVLGMLPTKRFDSVFLGADSPDWDLANQLRQLARATGNDFPADSGTRFLPYGLDLLDPRHVDALVAYVHEFGIGMFVIDVLLYAYGSADENSNSDMARVFHSLKRLRDSTDCAIVALHHWKKGTTEFRGAGTIVQAAEHTYTMTLKEHGVVELKRQKIRGESDWSELNLKLCPSELGGLHLALTEKPLAPMLMWFQFKPTLTREELEVKARSANYSAAWLGKSLTDYRRRGILVTDGKGTWSLASSSLSS